MKRILLTAALATAAVTDGAAQFGLPPAMQQTRRTVDKRQVQGIKLMQFYEELNKYYVDTLDNGKLVEDAIVKMLSNLDPHSAYLTAEEMKASNEEFGGSFSGIGVEFSVLADTLRVVTTVANGPAESVGMRPNDRITAVDGKSVIGIKTNDVHKVLRGPKGSVVTIEVERPGESEKLGFRIVRDDIPIHTIDAAYKIDGKTGYIKVNRFANNTITEFYKAFKEFGPIDALILDLRSNGGGLMNQGVLLANFFLPLGATVVSAEGRATPPVKYTARLNPEFPTGKLVVLMDEASASASEIVAGAIQDWDRGVVVGRPSFGKGLVQSQIPLVDGSAVRLTVAHYYTPSGRSIQRPYEQGNKEDYYIEAIKRRNADYVDSMRRHGKVYKTLRLNRDVVSEGGIYPDIWVESDTTGYSKYWMQLHRAGAIRDYVTIYMDGNRDRLKKEYGNFDKYLRSFQVTDQMLDELAELGRKRDIPYDEEGMNTSRRHIADQIKALIAQKLWDTTEYFRVIHSSGDEYIDKAMEVLRNWDTMSGLGKQ